MKQRDAASATARTDIEQESSPTPMRELKMEAQETERQVLEFKFGTEAKHVPCCSKEFNRFRGHGARWNSRIVQPMTFLRVNVHSERLAEAKYRRPTKQRVSAQRSGKKGQIDALQLVACVCTRP